MATLTSTGINCSNGTLDGFYTGTAANNTSYPLGSYVNASVDTCGQTLYMNQSYTLYCPNNLSFRFVYSYSIGQLTLAGTWRVRGVTLFQRVA